MRRVIKILIAAVLICGLASLFLTKPAQAFWQVGVSGRPVSFVTGDWSAPEISVKLELAERDYTVKNLLNQDCQVMAESALNETGLVCKLTLPEPDELPQWLSFKYQVSPEAEPLLTRPTLVIEVQDRDLNRVIFSDGVGLTADADWRYGWLDLNKLYQFADDQDQVRLVFRTLPSSTGSPPQVILSELSTLRLTAKSTDKLKLVANEPVSWRIDYQVGEETGRLNREGQEIQIGLDEFGTQVLPDSWQIKAVDLGGNESPVLKPQLYTADGNLDQVDIAYLEYHREVDGRLSLKFDLTEAWLDQVAGFSLRQKEADGWRKVDLVKVVPFIKPASSASIKGERVVLGTLDPVESADFCLDVLTLTGGLEELVCTY